VGQHFLSPRPDAAEGAELWKRLKRHSPKKTTAGKATKAARSRSRAPAKRLKTVEVDPKFAPVMKAFAHDRS